MTRNIEIVEARSAQIDDLPRIFDLLQQSEVSSVAIPIAHAQDIWAKTIAHEGVTVFVSDAGPIMAATCMLITAPNLLRAGRGHAFLENVVTHPESRGLGHGRAVVNAALSKAWAESCHHVLMQSGRKDPRVHKFYENCGFRSGVRIGYVATNPY